MPSTFSLPARTLSGALAEALARHADQAFGLMGNGNAHLIDRFPGAGIRLTEVRHEAGTVAAADAYTRVSGRIAIATATYGAGFTNTLTALAEAAQARTPMLVVVGDAPTTGARPWDVDQEMLAAAVGVRTVALAPGRIDEQVDRAAGAALRLRRPVVLAIPYDLAAAPEPSNAESRSSGDRGSGDAGIDLSDPGVTRELLAATRDEPAHAAGVDDGIDADVDAARESAATDPRAMAAALAALAAAERPVVIAGHGARISGAGGELARIAELLGALTGSTARARGIFPDARRDLGIVGGFGQEAAMAVLAEADTVLVAGAGLNQFTMRFGDLLAPGAVVVRIDVEEAPAPRTAHPVTQLLLQGDARTVLRELIPGLEAARPGPSTWAATVADGLEPGGALRTRDDGRAEHPEGVCADGLLDPRAVAARLAELLPEDRHVTSDGGHFIGWANMFWPVASPDRMVMVGTAYQTIGLGLSTVAGVAAAAPASTVVVTTGDGGGLMALADLETAIRAAARCVIVVWNDGAYGAEVHLYGEMGLDERAMLIPAVDFAGLGAALGATGVRVERLEDLEALARWREAGGTGTIVLDCRVSRSVVAPYQREVQKVNGLDPE